jgi:dienelactone hydrolase
MKFYFILALFLIVMSSYSYTQIHSEYISYYDGEVLLEGYFAYDKSFSGKRPAVIVVHDWKGISEFTTSRCDSLAMLGYVAFAADIYGKESRPANTKEAGVVASIYKNDRQLTRKRINIALDEVNKIDIVSKGKIAVIGYCFGGMVALELARSGADIKGAVSFHGNLDTPNPEDAKNIKSKILVLNGADDPYVPAGQIKLFEEEMNNAGVDWQFINYSSAVHSYTNPASGNDNSKGAAYNEKADKRSWLAMKTFFEEIFK